MSNFDPNYAAQRGVSADRAVAIDQGLRAYMIAVYNYMAIGVALTGVAAWLAFQLAGGDAVRITPRGITGLTDFGRLLFSMPGMIVMLIATFGLVLFISFRIDRLQPATALALFLTYAALLGVMLSSIFIQYTGTSITRVFFISAASFGALSLYGYTTQRDLSAFGAFLVMGLIGLLLAIIVNMFLQSSGLSFVISVVGVLIFAGLTAWDTQKIKEMYDANEDGTITARKAVMGALTLYLDFINLFLFLLRLIGDRR
ncbi:MAG: Bax inhibitor-1/YccA family protein [Hyphomicrobiales bacterium]|nr:Bax inhibitor-1/YccA family protein [Hyphomicrobiales bacterium]